MQANKMRSRIAKEATLGPTEMKAVMEVGADEVSESSGAYKRDVWFKRLWDRISGNY